MKVLRSISRELVKKILRGVKKVSYPCIRYLIRRSIRRKRLRLDCSLWGLGVNEKEHLVIGGCDCVELAGEYGTPLHVVDKGLLQRTYNEFYESFNSHAIDSEIYYSYKTNPIPGILRVLHDSGAGAEVISPYELWLAFKLKVSPDSIIYNGPSKSSEALKIAVENKIKLINVNSFNEIENIENIAKGLGTLANVGVRVCTGVGWSGKFGFGIKSGAAFKAFEKLNKMKHVEIKGIHVHAGTGIKSTFVYERVVEEVFKLINEIRNKMGICIKYVDLGGGFGVPTVRQLHRIESKLNRMSFKPYTPPDFKDTPSIRMFADKIVAAVRRECERYELKPPVLLFEPGRVVTSGAQVLLTKLCDLKEQDDDVEIAIVDAGINIAHLVTWEYHEMFVVNKMNSRYEKFYKIAGPICTPADVLSGVKKLPLLEVGDIVSIMDAGAYFSSLSSSFSFPRPAIVMASNGKHHVLRGKESYEYMVLLDSCFIE